MLLFFTFLDIFTSKLIISHLKMRTRQASGISSRKFNAAGVMAAADIPLPCRRRRNLMKKKRNRNQCTETATMNKWVTYRKNIHRLLLTLTRDEHFCTTLSVQRSSDSIVLLGQLQHYGEKIMTCKQNILKQFEHLVAENGDDKRHMALSVPDDNGMVDLESINCSKCDGVDTENDDILFCDRDGCFRAYHQSCLDPTIQKDLMSFEDPDEDWFCWQCECLDDCLDMVNDMCNTDVTAVRELFPELRQDPAEGMHIAEEMEEESDEDDEDYNSDCSADSQEQDSNDDDDDHEEEDGEGGTDNDGADEDDADEDVTDGDEDEILAIEDDEVLYDMYCILFSLVCSVLTVLFSRYAP